MGNLSSAFRQISRALRHLIEGLSFALRESFTNLILLAGLATIVRGCALISEALAYCVAGAFLLAVGFVLSFGETIRRRTGGR